MKKMFKPIALLLALTLLLASCSFSRDKDNKATTVPENTTAVKDVTMKKEQRRADRLSMQLEYPETVSEVVNGLILSEVNKFADDFKKQANAFLAANEAQCSMQLKSEVAPYKENAFNVCYTVNAQIGDSRYNTSYARVYNTSENAAYAIADFFGKENATYLEELSAAVKESVRKNNLPVDSWLLEQGTHANAACFSSFMIFGDKFTFVFPSGQLADESIRVDVQLSALTSFQAGAASVSDFSQLEAPENIETDVQPGTTVPEGTTQAGKEPETTAKRPEYNGKKRIALTFDDGPGAHTDRLLEALKQYNAKATFFMVGTSLDSFPEQAKHVYEAGCEIGNHTYSHKTLTKLDAAGLESEIGRVDSILEKLTGEKPKLMRPPGGSINDNVRAAGNRPFILWNVDTEDWKHKDADYVYDYVMKTVSEGDIVLMHDIHKTSVDAAVRLIKALTEQGYELVTISELFEIYGPKLENGKAYYAITGSGWK